MSYIQEIEKPEKQLCPYHTVPYKKGKRGKFWHCPKYGECGYSIGSRRSEGYFIGLWIQQTKAGKKWVSDVLEEIFDRDMDEAG